MDTILKEALMTDPGFQTGFASLPRVHSPLTVSQELLSIEFLDLWAGLIPRCLETLRKCLRAGHSGLEITRLDHNHLHPKVGELPPASKQAEGQGFQRSFNINTKTHPKLVRDQERLRWDSRKHWEVVKYRKPKGEV